MMRSYRFEALQHRFWFAEERYKKRHGMPERILLRGRWWGWVNRQKRGTL